ncbi:HAD-IB family phosphatase [Persicirhabdus sediminis]|uniref:phosphoserine phosphatase n=1 Tax=Persicirhabdus sediminis TaxID=454144 RepID=A0A8J7MC68_9BACT|nr:HAD-IB family phosphatase [Persicirhabdus sediminis]MBK1789742.1 HAD-IB family phosphatase [Persicirhabdus sediminis]
MKLIVFDCDSTLSAIEGIDELARGKGDAVFEEVVALTHAAMNGEVAIDEIFAKRLDIIQPDRATADAVGQLYIDQIEPTAKATIDALREQGWTPIIISGGFIYPIQPLADLLGIDRIEAVPLHFNDDGSYAGFTASPTTRNGGKPEIIKQLKEEFQPSAIVMVGDGVSDLETASEVDAFVGFGRYTPREKVKAAAEHFVYAIDEIPAIIEGLG